MQRVCAREETAEKTIFSLFPPFKEFLSHHSLAGIRGSRPNEEDRRRSGREQCSPKSSLFARPSVRLSSKFKPTTMIGRQREEQSAEEIVYLSARPDRLFADTFDVDGWSWLSQGGRRLLLLKIQGPTFSASSGEGRF